MIGAFQGGFTLDRFGRKFTIQMGALICLVGATLQAAAQNLSMILAGRILAGWGVGIMSMSVPVYQAECAHPRSRGLIVGLSQQMIGVGFIVSTWVGYGSLRASDTSQLQWRFPLAFQVVPALVLVIGMVFVPESPRFLVEKGHHAEAMRVLRRLHYDGSNDDWIEAEFNEIRQASDSGKSVAEPGWVSMFTVAKWRTRMLHGLAVQVFTAMTGVNVITYYQTIMYKALGITGSRNTLVAGIYNCVGPLANLIFVVFFLDRVGRRKPLLFGTVAISIALTCEAILTSQNPDGQRIRSKGNAFAVGIGNWATNTLWNQVSPIALGQIQWRLYFVFVAWNLCVSFPIIYFFFRETKQKTLEEIDLLFDRSLGVSEEEVQSEKAGSTTIEASFKN
ncbi:uncharacterized protein N7484_006336 [Penicillium longicatenatum]|uniref:uncharacterized protein n=1 Tax=Penicillium longicatenatum TaxID=1561947 RepID=UPI002546CB62|nr:uncharacterized protein N7484_006336 [Penicillium longicatenatum]KAJ5643829.1 hypothetical protein N7484_006336 [Penicillium longicatenatum]